MNALASIEQNLTIVLNVATPAEIFAPGGVEGILSKIETEVRAIDRDISTPDGRENVKSLAYKVARSKTALDEMGKELVAGIKAQAATIDAERRTIRERLDALKDEVRGPLTAWETAEAERIDGHERALVYIVGSVHFPEQPRAADVREQIERVSELAARDWQEFKERADAAIFDALGRLNVIKTAAEQLERDAAELAELRRLKAEREAADRAAACEALNAENARRAAEAQAEHERQRAEQIEREKEAAAARAVEQERQRAAAEKAAEKAATEKREANKRHRAKIRAEICNALTMEGGLTEEQMNWLFNAIAAGRIPHVSITY